MKQMLVPFIDKSTDLIGFARCYGDGDILLDAQYEDLYYDGSALVPVQKNGKWGLVDMEMKKCIPLVMPCEYKSKDAVLNAYKNQQK